MAAGQFYTAYMDNLKPYTEYEYYVGAAAPSARPVSSATAFRAQHCIERHCLVALLL
jgi:hypothetical protein